jgi:guanidinopropionase
MNKGDKLMHRNLFQLAELNPQYSLGRRRGIATFITAPIAENLENVDVGIIGVPFDGGMSATPGAAEAPREIRNQCLRRGIGAYNGNLEINLFEKHRVRDCGDVVLSRFSIGQATETITEAVTAMLDRNILQYALAEIIT